MTMTDRSRKPKAGTAQQKLPGKKYVRPNHSTTLCGACAVTKTGGCCPIGCPLYRNKNSDGSTVILK